MLGVAVELICHWIPAHRGSRMSNYYSEKYERSPVYFNLKETSLKRRNRCEIQWEAVTSLLIKRKKFCKCCAWDLNTGPLDYEAKALLLELSYQMIFK